MLEILCFSSLVIEQPGEFYYLTTKVLFSQHEICFGSLHIVFYLSRWIADIYHKMYIYGI